MWFPIPSVSFAVRRHSTLALRQRRQRPLAQQTQWHGWQHLCRLPRAISHDLFAYVTERLCLEDLRQVIAAIVKILKATRRGRAAKSAGCSF